MTHAIALLLPLVVAAIAALDGLLAHRAKYRDRRTREHRRGRAIRSSLIVALAAGSVVVTWQAERGRVAEQRRLKKMSSVLEERHQEALFQLKQAEGQRAKLHEEIATVSGQLEPFIAIATERFEGSDEVALGLLLKEMRDLRQRAAELESSLLRDQILRTYVPPSQALRTRILKQLADFERRYPSTRVVVWCEEGDVDRSAVCRDLAGILSGSGVETKFEKGRSFHERDLGGIRMSHDETATEMFEQFFNALLPYLHGPVTRTRRNDTDHDIITIRVEGRPEFAELTGVSFR